LSYKNIDQKHISFQLKYMLFLFKTDIITVERQFIIDFLSCFFFLFLTIKETLINNNIDNLRKLYSHISFCNKHISIISFECL